MCLKTLIAACLTLCLANIPCLAQDGPFSPRLYVNDSVISNYEYDQRVLFLKAVNSPGDTEEQAMTALIEDRLRVGAAQEMGISLTEEQLTEGINEFAGRANLTSDQFLASLGEKGVDAETFRDFVEANILWREVVRAKYGPLTQVSDSEVDLALSPASRRGDLRVLISELIIPAPPGQEADAQALAEELSTTIRSESAFAEAARQFSAASSAQVGGKIDWLDLGKLPPSIGAILLRLSPGEVTAPIAIPNAVALFQLRAVQETGLPPLGPVTIDYAQVLLPDTAEGLATAARIQAGADECDDLYTLLHDLPPDQLLRETQSSGQIPADIGLALAPLDENEMSFTLRRGNVRVLLMLCSRTVIPADGEPPAREQVRLMLINQRLAQFAEIYLQELQDAAIIRKP